MARKSEVYGETNGGGAITENHRKLEVYGDERRGGELTSFDKVSRHGEMIRNDRISRR